MVVRLAFPTQAWLGVPLGVGPFGHSRIWLNAPAWARTTSSRPSFSPAISVLASAALRCRFDLALFRIGLSERCELSPLPRARQRLSHVLQRVRHPPQRRPVRCGSSWLRLAARKHLPPELLSSLQPFREAGHPLLGQPAAGVALYLTPGSVSHGATFSQVEGSS